MYDHIRDIFHSDYTDPQIIQKQTQFDKLPYLLGELPQCTIAAARFVRCLHKKRATSEEQTPL